MNVYDIGDQVEIVVNFATAEGVATDPTVVECQYRRPNGSVTTVEYIDGSAIVRDAAGAYRLAIVVDQPGAWSYRWAGSGTVTAAAEGQFMARRSMF